MLGRDEQLLHCLALYKTIVASNTSTHNPCMTHLAGFQYPAVMHDAIHNKIIDA
jgi:hypothetical protein